MESASQTDDKEPVLSNFYYNGQEHSASRVNCNKGILEEGLCLKYNTVTPDAIV